MIQKVHAIDAVLMSDDGTKGAAELPLPSVEALIENREALIRELTAEVTHLQTQAQELRDKLMLAGYSSIATPDDIRANELHLREMEREAAAVEQEQPQEQPQ